MKTTYHKTLFKNHLLDEKQFDVLEEVYAKKKVSLFYELRTMLFLGVMLFSTGVGFLIYQNIDLIGHVGIITVLTLLCGACFYYTLKKSSPFQFEKVESPSPYYDYVTLLGALLLVSIVTYVFILTPSIYDFLGFSSITLAICFIGIAYRFDQLAILSLGITALASYFGLSLSTQKWYDPSFFESASLYQTAIVFSVCLAGVGSFLDFKKIKTHFTFTYLNYAALLFFTGCNTGLFINGYNGFYALLQIVGSALTIYLGRKLQSYLFLIYGFVFGYIALIYSLVQLDSGDNFVFIFYFSVFICIGFVLLFLKTKKTF